MLTFGELANRLHKMWMNLLPRRCRVHNFMLTWCAWTRQRHVICQAYEQASQHIDDTSGHSQNTNFQITSDILLRAFFMCVFIRSMRSSYYYSDFPTQHAVASFSIDFCSLLLMLMLLCICLHCLSTVCPWYVLCTSISRYVQRSYHCDVRTVINIKFLGETHTHEEVKIGKENNVSIAWFYAAFIF